MVGSIVLMFSDSSIAMETTSSVVIGKYLICAYYSLRNNNIHVNIVTLKLDTVFGMEIEAKGKNTVINLLNIVARYLSKMYAEVQTLQNSA